MPEGYYKILLLDFVIHGYFHFQSLSIYKSSVALMKELDCLYDIADSL